MKTILCPFLVVASVLATVAAAAPDSAHTAVRAAPVVLSGEAIPVHATGIAGRREEAGLGFVTDGLVAQVWVRAGDVVTQGQVLASLRLDEVEATREQAQASLAKALRDRERAERLLAEKVIGVEEAQNAATAVDQAAAALKAAEFARRYAVIQAPSPGRILWRDVEPNELVQAGRPVLGFGSEDGGWILRVALSSRDVVKVHPGDRATWYVAPGGTSVWDAVVTHVAEGSDPVTRTVEVELSPDAVPEELRSGFVVHVVIRPAAVAPRPRVPASSLVEGDGNAASIYVVDRSAQRVERRAVVVEALYGADAYLATPLPEGAEVVIRGAEFLRDGEAVRVEEGSP